MKKTMLLFSFTLLCNLYSLAQAAQFEVVRPNGTTYICPTWDSAYSKAVNDDYIYLPGFSYLNSNFYVNKRIHIIGTGNHPDSTIATGISNIAGVILYSNASGGSIEGVTMQGAVYINSTSDFVNGYSIKRCRIGGTLSLNGNNHNNFFISENIIIGSILQADGIGDFINKNIIQGNNNRFTSSSVSNNIFTSQIAPYANNYYSAVILNSSNTSYNNNIFCSQFPFNISEYNLNTYAQCGNNFNNNLKIGIGNLLNCTSSPTEFNTLSADSVGQIFVNYPNSATTFLYAYDFHLKPNSLWAAVGNNGTAVGIYGTNSPTPIGWVPSNPHIYFKQVQGQTSADGRLQINFKVRAGN